VRVEAAFAGVFFNLTTGSMEKRYDYIVIGSGFGGSVAAMRLAEKGYSVLVIEKGRRYREEDYPLSDWNLPKFLWLPALRWFGFQKLTFFRQVTILSGVGVGGGSIVYGNTHMFPPDAFFNNPVWSGYRDWKSTLLPFYDLARRMLGTLSYERLAEEDHLLREVARDMGKEHTFSGVNVGVYMGDPEKSRDPYFGGLGPERMGCRECAGCMVGCRYNAKNTLDKNYLYFAEKYGAHILPETEVIRIDHREGLYRISAVSTTAWRRQEQEFIASGLFVSGGVLGTLRLLLRQKFAFGSLPLLSDRLGDNVLTNSESLCGVSNADRKLNHGVAISSYFNPDEHTHIEVVKYNDQSGAMGRLGTLAVGRGSGAVRTAKWIAQVIRHPIRFLRISFTFRKWGERSIIFLVMQSLDNSMRLIWRKGLFGGRMSFRNDKESRVPAYIEAGQEVMKRYAGKVNGIAQNVWPEILLDMPMTAHILGGCPMGRTAAEGVVNEEFAVHHYPGMYILDGSIIPCNLGVNPSLSITALSEYAMSRIPAKPGHRKSELQQRLEEVMVQKIGVDTGKES
jgi:cholesterol oxidase